MEFRLIQTGVQKETFILNATCWVYAKDRFFCFISPYPAYRALQLT